MWQCHAKGIDAGPINTFNGWRALGRHVRKGQKAMQLCMPVVAKSTEIKDGQEVEKVYTRFIFPSRWFVLSQTDGQEYNAPTFPKNWDKAKALQTLNITEKPFTKLNGNIQGYSYTHEFAINPLAENPAKTLFHEMAHIMLGHTENADHQDGLTLPRSLKEAEAESVAMLLCETLELPGAEFSRGYIQDWLSGDVIPERSAQRIFSAADKILRAGLPESTKLAA